MNGGRDSNIQLRVQTRHVKKHGSPGQPQVISRNDRRGTPGETPPVSESGVRRDHMRSVNKSGYASDVNGRGGLGDVDIYD